MCTAPSVSLNRWGKSRFAYCHAMSISRVGTKKEVGADAMRSRNLVWCVSDVKHYLLSIQDVRMVSGNTVV